MAATEEGARAFRQAAWGLEEAVDVFIRNRQARGYMTQEEHLLLCERHRTFLEVAAANPEASAVDPVGHP